MYLHEKWMEEPIFDILVEGKQIGWKKKWDNTKKFRALGMALKMGKAWKERKRRKAKLTRRKFNNLKEKFKKEGWKWIELLRGGNIDVSTAYRKLRELFKDYYHQAFMLGYESSGLSDFIEVDKEELKWVDSALREETKYLLKFLQDVATSQGKMDYLKRWEMYVNTLDHVYWGGRMVVVPEGFVIDWVLMPAEHCEGCILLAKNSPYTRDTLPTTPRAGATPCLSNCKCRLRIREPKDLIEYKAAKNKSKASLLLRLKRIKDGV